MNQVFQSADERDPNYRLYLLLKEFNGGQGLSDRLHRLFLEVLIQDNLNFECALSDVKKIIKDMKSSTRHDNLERITSILNSELDFVLLRFSVCLLSVKEVLLEQAKSIKPMPSSTSQSHKLSLENDNEGKKAVYLGRVSSSLLAREFFDKLREGDQKYVASFAGEISSVLISDFTYLEGNGVHALEMFMLMFSESVNQGIRSGAGVNYEDRILEMLLSLGIERDKIRKVHDSSDDSTEFDFLFTHKARNYGIGAKRTLRERYKQFIKTARELDCQVMIEITLGIDLPETKAKTITGYGVHLFVADEIYKENAYLQYMEMIYPVSMFSLSTLESLKSLDQLGLPSN